MGHQWRGFSRHFSGRGEATLRVLVLWADSRSANLGVQVLAYGMKELARRAWGSDVQVDFQDYGRGDSDVAFGNRAIVADLGKRRGDLKVKLSSYDLIIDSGAGDSFADIYGAQRLLWMANANRLAASLNVPVVLGPQTIGPFNTWWGKAIGRYVMQRANQVHSRDRASSDYVSELLGRRPDVSSTDVVFALPVPNVSEKRDVLLNVSGLLWQENHHVDYEKYRRVIREIIAEMTRNGRTVSLLSHVIESESPDNDVPVCRALADELNLEALVPVDVTEARRMVASAELVIGSRMHACLNALSVGTRSLPLAYSRKFAPLMNDIGWSHVHDLRDEDLTVERIVAEAEELLRGEYDDELDALRANAESRLSDSIEALKKISLTA
ncbi:polysaccharide pyruvyl transferase family protein [Microbacterium amylolyticum]|uniref:Polysaccharide pyruvyl transferase WcaK-like protein n=1 Tax=Microbacterium amylolyticum TaxID=936337 RepID=A0ABS4ZIF4_9MICO|nr:polysaccharide pyruvyl transferase family protein [Microbacterium amylolyticum]MBP2437069.1 polysaccharide pyruvyl transferase WcaK-like protein [Microbacterium amylolyticum]